MRIVARIVTHAFLLNAMLMMRGNYLVLLQLVHFGLHMEGLDKFWNEPDRNKDYGCHQVPLNGHHVGIKSCLDASIGASTLQQIPTASAMHAVR